MKDLASAQENTVHDSISPFRAEPLRLLLPLLIIMPSFTERKAQLEAARAEQERWAREEFEAEEREIRELEEEERQVEEEGARREQQRAEEERKKAEEAERRRRVEESQKGTEETEMVMGDAAACWNCRSRGAECVRQR